MLHDWFKTSLIRTVLPVAWGSLITFLVVQFGLTPEIADSIASFEPVITAVVIGIWYAVTRAVEPRLPGWLATILFGSTQEPEYHVED